MRQPVTSRPFSRTLVATALTLAVSHTAFASSHREAPGITAMPKVDATDFYAFGSYEDGRGDYVTLIANYLPLQDAYGGPDYFAMDTAALYEIHVDNTGPFAVYVTHPTLPALIDVLFRDAVGATDNIAPSNLPRTDLVTAFLTGFPGVNQLPVQGEDEAAAVVPAEMLRLNTAVPATAAADQQSLGVAAGETNDASADARRAARRRVGARRLREQ